MPVEAHLMIEEPGRYVAEFAAAGADLLTIHAEAVDDPRAAVEQIHADGVAAGLAINPSTPVSAILPALDLCDLVLVMSVMPGFGGQEFEPEALDKLRQLRTMVGPNVLLSVDGGVNM